MAHKEQRSWTMQMASLFPSHFKNQSVIDIGSADLNGNTRHLFNGCFYMGLDIWKGPNVDIVWPHDWAFDIPQDIYISCEALEHDKSYRETFSGMIKGARNMVVMTCASDGRAEHGTKETTPEYSPYTTDYYKNLTQIDLEPLVKDLYWYKFFYNPIAGDIYFIGFKRKPVFKPAILKYIWMEIYYFLFVERVRDYKNAFLRLIRRFK